MRRGVVRYGVVWCGVVCGVVWCNAVRGYSVWWVEYSSFELVLIYCVQALSSFFL